MVWVYEEARKICKETASTLFFFRWFFAREARIGFLWVQPSLNWPSGELEPPRLAKVVARFAGA